MNLTRTPELANIPISSIYGGVCMTGKVRTKEKCPVCGGKFILGVIGDQPELICPTCKTRPRTYFVDTRGFGIPKVYKDPKTLEPFRYYEAADQLLKTLRKKSKERELDPRDYIRLEVEKMLLKTLSEGWLKWVEKELSASYLRHCKTEMKDHIIPFLGGYDVRDIKTHVFAFHEHLKDAEKKLEPKSIKNILGTLSAFMTWLSDPARLIIGRPHLPVFPKIKVPQKAKGWINHETQMRIINYIPAQHQLIMHTIRESGCRSSEACALKKMDLLDGEICICRAFDEKGNEKGEKNEKVKYRGISLWLWQALREHAKDLRLEDYLFRDQWGQLYNADRLYDIWDAAAQKEGVRISLMNGTRHSRASQKRLEMEKQVAEACRQELSHSSSRTTMEHYALDRGNEIKTHNN